MADEYISREDVLDIIEDMRNNHFILMGERANLAFLKSKITELPVADVQPVPQWISVKDRLPESEKEVLVWYRYTWGAAPTSYGFGINVWHFNIKQWREGCLLKGVEVLYWQPLPSPPKDGDIE